MFPNCPTFNTDQTTVVVCRVPFEKEGRWYLHVALDIKLNEKDIEKYVDMPVRNPRCKGRIIVPWYASESVGGTDLEWKDEHSELWVTINAKTSEKKVTFKYSWDGQFIQ